MAASAESGDVGSEAKAVTTITLISSDNERFEVPEAAANMSQTIRHMIEDGCADGGIPLPNVTAAILAKALEYCNKHASSEAAAPAGGSANNNAAAAAASSSDSKITPIDTSITILYKSVIRRLTTSMAASVESGDDVGSEAQGVTTITLISSDNERFEVPAAAANMSQTIRHMIEDGCADGGIPLPNVTAAILAKALEYCNKHAAAAASSEDAAPAGGSANNNAAAAASSSDAGSSSSTNAAAPPQKQQEEEDLKTFDKSFIDVDQSTLYDLLLAANYLEVKGLLDLACQKVADMIKGKTPEEIRQTFGIKNDFTPEEYEEIRKENSWAFPEQ